LENANEDTGKGDVSERAEVKEKGGAHLDTGNGTQFPPEANAPCVLERERDPQIAHPLHMQLYPSIELEHPHAFHRTPFQLQPHRIPTIVTHLHFPLAPPPIPRSQPALLALLAPEKLYKDSTLAAVSPDTSALIPTSTSGDGKDSPDGSFEFEEKPCKQAQLPPTHTRSTPGDRQQPSAKENGDRDGNPHANATQKPASACLACRHRKIRCVLPTDWCGGQCK
jgi:hypothetical protein